MQFSCFPVLPGSAGAQGIWCGIIKRLLIAYFIDNICAKKYRNQFTCQSYSKPKVGRFLRHGVVCRTTSPGSILDVSLLRATVQTD